MSTVDTVPLTSPWNSIDWNVTLRKVRQIQTCIVKYLKPLKRLRMLQVWVLKGALCGLELCDGKLSCTVLRGACGLVTVRGPVTATAYSTRSYVPAAAPI